MCVRDTWTGCLSQLWTWPATQACALTGNRTGDLLVCRPAFNPLSHTSQGYSIHLTWLTLFPCQLLFFIPTFQMGKPRQRNSTNGSWNPWVSNSILPRASAHLSCEGSTLTTAGSLRARGSSGLIHSPQELVRDAESQPLQTVCVSLHL